ncbi:MAG: DNA-directed RNA polymerase subunit K [Theionarchaea archaeon]|nr:MAG: DNA-directed RNA polymerase subunit K [Theionarchaea archaeon DG-70]MBU7013154.1 DNA-directed RNA polymerase subunit K [Theionarchaea archaeon]
MSLWCLNVYTRFEKARIVGARALQIAMGAPILIKTKEKDCIRIAIEELERGIIPITVVPKTKRV